MCQYKLGHHCFTTEIRSKYKVSSDGELTVPSQTSTHGHVDYVL